MNSKSTIEENMGRQIHVVMKRLVLVCTLALNSCTTDDMITTNFVIVNSLPDQQVTLGIVEQFLDPVPKPDSSLTSRERHRLGLQANKPCLVIDRKNQCDTLPLRVRPRSEHGGDWSLKSYDSIHSELFPFKNQKAVKELIVVIETSRSDSAEKEVKHKQEEKHSYFWVVDLEDCEELFFRQLEFYSSSTHGHRTTTDLIRSEIFIRNDTIFEVFPRNGWKQAYAYTREEDRYVVVDSFAFDKPKIEFIDPYFQL